MPNVSQKQTTYVFVDGSHFRQYFNETTQKGFGIEVEFDFKKVKDFFKAEKAFYYDCINDIKNDSETVEQFDARVNEQQEKLNKIREVEGCHVYLGSLRRAKKQKKRGQKEVDVMLAVQMMEHAFRGNMNKTVLLSGDLDFRPLVESLVRLGLFIEVVGDQNHISQELIHSADSHRKITFDDYYHWTTEEHKLNRPLNFTRVVFKPSIHHNQSPLIHQGTWNDMNVFIYEPRANREYYLFCDLFEDTALTSNHPKSLFDYFELRYGKIDGINL